MNHLKLPDGLRLLKVLAGVTLGACMSAEASQFTATIVDGEGHPLPDAVVVLVPVGGVKVALHPHEEIVDQIDREFVPHVKAILVGSTVRFPNQDNIRHHVYSFSVAKNFELPLYKGTQAAPVLFDKAGVVVLGCNIHDWMLGYIYVSESPYYGMSGDDGKIVIKDLPKGNYEARVWQPDMQATEESTARALTLESGDAVGDWQIALKKTAKLRRAPVGAGHSYQ